MFGGEGKSVVGGVDYRVCRRRRCAFLEGSRNDAMIGAVALAVVGM